MTRKATTAGDVSTLTGTGSSGSADNTGTSASHNNPNCATMDSVRRSVPPPGDPKQSLTTHTHTHIPCPQTNTYFYVTDGGSYLLRLGIFRAIVLTLNLITRSRVTHKRMTERT